MYPNFLLTGPTTQETLLQLGAPLTIPSAHSALATLTKDWDSWLCLYAN